MKFTMLGLVAVAAAMPAFAQDAGPRSWTGPYAGVRAGYSFQPKDRNEQIAFDTNLDGTYGDTVRTTTGTNAFSPGFCGGYALGATPATGCKKDEDSLDFGIHAGYDYDFGGPVVGVVAELGYGFARDFASAYSTTPASYVMIRRMKENAGVRGRAGYTFGTRRNTLVYGTGGIVFAKMQDSIRSTNVLNAYTIDADRKVMGWRAGAGVEQRFAKHVTIGLQYLFTSLDDDRNTVRVSRGAQPATNPFVLVNSAGTDLRRGHSRFATHNISVTANYRF